MSWVVENLTNDLIVQRLIAPRHAETAFSGDGARLHGGRWNSKGFPVVYTSSSLALAVLEMLVQANPLPVYIKIPATLPSGLLIAHINTNKVPVDWQSAIAPPDIQKFGDAWMTERRTCVLRVPSAIIPDECNYLLNPAHPDFARITIDTPAKHLMDDRLLKSLNP